MSKIASSNLQIPNYKQFTIFKNKLVISLLIVCLWNFAASVFAYAQSSTIAYTRLTNGYWQIWTKKLDGDPVQMTTTSYDKRMPVWSPNGKKILYRTNNRELFLVDVETKKETQLLKNFGWMTDPVFFKDDSHILFARFDSNIKDKSDLYTSDLEGTERTLITNKTGLQYAPSLSPDQKQIVYVSGHGYGTHEIYLLDLETKKETQLTKNQSLEIHPVFSPDGKQIAYASDAASNFDIFVRDLKTHEEKRITDWLGTDLSPSWSPDGKQIAFTSDRGGTLQIWVMDANGENAHVFVQEKIASQEPSWK